MNCRWLQAGLCLCSVYAGAGRAGGGLLTWGGYGHIADCHEAAAYDYDAQVSSHNLHICNTQGMSHTNSVCFGGWEA